MKDLSQKRKPKWKLMREKFRKMEWCQKFLEASREMRFLYRFERVSQANGNYPVMGDEIGVSEVLPIVTTDLDDVDVTLDSGYESYNIHVELMPVVGENLQELIQYLRDKLKSDKNTISLVVGEFRNTSVSVDDFKNMFRNRDIRVIFESEIESINLSEISPIPDSFM